MRILITGAAGMLGSDVRTACEAGGHEPLAVARSSVDITDQAAVQETVARSRPDIVINCAAWTDVDGAEEHYPEAVSVNGAAAGTVARAAAAQGAWTIHVSSDYVFDGRKTSPYVESDPVKPLSAYGRSKLEGERAVAAAAPERHTIIRSSWLFGAAGKCFPKTILRLAGEREQIDVVSDQVGCPTYTGHLAQALIELAAAPPLGVLHVTCAGECSWFDLAQKVVAIAGLDCEVRPILTEQYPLPAQRPAYSVMRSERGAPALPGWQEGLREFMSQIAEVPA
jgi:dTDP-4-dehydrorhamnose reductase